MSGLSGVEIKAAFKKGRIWNVPEVAGANDGVLLRPTNLKRDTQINIDDSLGLYFSKDGLPGPIKVEGDMPAYLRYDGLDVLLALFMGTAGAPAQQGGTAAYAYTYKWNANLDGLFGTFVKSMKNYIQEYPSTKLVGMTIKGETGKTLECILHTIASNQRVIPDSNRVVATTTVGTSPYGVAYCPKTDQIFVANYGGNNVSVIDPATNSVVATITVGIGPRGLAYCPKTDQIFVANYGGNNVSVIDPATNSVVATIAVGTGPMEMAYCPTTDRIFVANYGGNNISVINPATNSVVATITVGTGPHGVTYCPITDQIFIVNAGDNNVSVIIPPSNTLSTFVNVTNFEESNRIKFSDGIFRMNNQSGNALTDSDRIYPASFEFVAKRKLKGEYTGEYKTYYPNVQDIIDEPCNESMPEITLKLTFPRHMSSTNIAALIADTRKKMDITFTGALIAGSYYRKFTLQCPHLQFKDVPVADAQGNIKEPLEFIVHGCSTAPLGMTGLTDPFWISGINQRTTDPLA